MNANQFVAPSGYVELDNDCEFSIDRKSTRSRESVDPKTDLAFYFNTYIIFIHCKKDAIISWFCCRR